MIKGILFDLDGVLYVSERAIDGAHSTLEWVERQGIPHLFLTNTTSRPRSAIVDKLAGMGIHIDPGAILTPAVEAPYGLEEAAAPLGPGASALMTKYMEKQIEKLDFPGIAEFIEMIHDTGAGLYACLASVELFGMERDDLIEELDDIITVGDFYEMAAGGQIIFT